MHGASAGRRTDLDGFLDHLSVFRSAVSDCPEIKDIERRRCAGPDFGGICLQVTEQNNDRDGRNQADRHERIHHVSS